MKRILIVSFTRTQSDPRIQRHISALENEYELVTCGRGEADPASHPHLRLASSHRMIPPTAKGRAALLFGFNRSAYQKIPLVAETAGILRGMTFDAAITNDIEPVSVVADALEHTPVIADLHEYAPRQYEERWRWRLLAQRMNIYQCKTALPKAAAVTTVAPGIAEEYSKNFRVAPITTITNAAPGRRPRPRPVGDPIRLVHSGVADPTRNLEAMIRAVADMSNVTLDLFLVASKVQSSYVDELRQLSQRTTNVRLRPPVPMTELPAVLDDFDVGLYLLRPNSFNKEHALPNKLFEWIQSGLAIVVGPSPEMAKIVRKFDLGFVVPSFEEANLRSALRALDRSQIQRWKENSCSAALVLNAEREAENLRNLVANTIRESEH